MQHSCERASRVRSTGKACDYTLGSRESGFRIRRKIQTEDADGIAFVVVLHEELVSVHDVFREIPREHLVQDLSPDAKERRDDARLKVRPDASLYHLGQLG